MIYRAKNILRNFLIAVKRLIEYKLLYLIIVSVYLLNHLACSNKQSLPKISEGEIEYQIEYLDDERKNPFIMLLPRQMLTTFSNNSSHTRIEGFFGTFKLTYILNYKQQKNYTLLQIMDKKYVYQADINNLAFGYENMKNIHLNYTDKQKIIAGFNCKHATAYFFDGLTDTIEIYYTEEIKLDKPNLNNPFRNLNGVLMEFTVNLMGINMKVKTTKVNRKKVNENLYDMPNGYTKITLNEMEKIVNDFNLTSNK
jgi:GLPGLI family protein